MNVLDTLFEQHSFRLGVSRGEYFFHRFPHLPSQLMEFLVSLLPAIFFALGILHAVMGALVMITGTHFLTQLQTLSPVINPLYLMMNGMLAISNGLFMLLAFTEIKRQTENGWRTFFLINLVSILQSILSIVFTPRAIFSVILYIAITMYLTFEFKPYFKKVI
ncbi:MAG: hypothetical protein ABI425_01185 [Patescibacteria group bacterium]